MSETANNPLNDFLNAAEEENDLFADFPFPTPKKNAGAEPAQKEVPPADQAEFEEITPEEPAAPRTVQQQKQASLFEAALAQTPAAQQSVPTKQEENDPFTAA